MPMTSYRKKLEATARALHSDDLIDDNTGITSTSEWIQEAKQWLKEAIPQAEKMLKEVEQNNLKLDELLERIDAIKAQKKASRKQHQDNIEMLTIRIPTKTQKPYRRLVRAA